MRSALLVFCAGLAGCGGSGGGGPQAGTLRGSLVLEQSPPAPRSELGGGITLRREREPDDHLFSAVDLGDGRTPVALEGSVGSDADPVDVLRLGPAVGDSDLTLGFHSEAGELWCLTVAASGEPEAVARVSARGELRLRLRPGQERALVVRSSRPDRYRLTVEPGSRADIRPPPAVATTAVAAMWQQVLGGEECAPGEVLIARAPALGPQDLVELGLELVAEGGGVQRLRDPRVASVPLGVQARLALANLLRRVRRARPDAVYVSPNLRTPLSALAAAPVEPSDPLFADQFNLSLTRFPEAWALTTGRDDVTIAVMDTGILPMHPDLAPRLSPLGYDFISDKDNAGDGDGVDPDPSEPQEFGAITWFHGTYVTGLLGAVTDNATGIAGGVWRGKIIPVRIFGRFGGTSFDRVQALRYLAGLPNASGRTLKPEERPRVVNLSYAIATPTAAEKTETLNLAKAGIHLVAAVGNDARNPSPPLYPAAWPEVTGVGSVDRLLRRAVYSNGASWVDVMAPGGTEVAGPDGVVSTWGVVPSGRLQYVYNSFAGTSVAAPTVSAALALMEAVHPRMSAAVVSRILEETSKDLGPPGRDDEYGWGLLQADAAVARAAELGPDLVLTPSGYAFRDAETRTELLLENGGGGTLAGLSVTSVGSGSGAIRVALEGSEAPTRIVATVDRRGVRVGTYRDRFRLTSTTVGTEFELTFRKPIPDAPPTIELRLWSDGALLVSSSTGADGSFELAGLPAGRYRLQAGVDRNRNGILGDSQEWFLEREVEVGASRTAELNGVIVPWKD